MQQAVTVRRDGNRVHLSNPSLRFLRVVRRDDDGDHVLEDLLPPYGTLVDRVSRDSGEVRYLAAGAGFAVPTSLDDSLLGETYGPTTFFSLVLPILELAGGNRISIEDGLRLYESREPVPPRLLAESLASGHGPTVEAAVMDTEAIHVSDLADLVTESLSNVAELITVGSYLAGLAFSIGAIMKFKQHKDNPTQVPVGTPVALVFIAAALLFLPSILGLTVPRPVESR